MLVNRYVVFGVIVFFTSVKEGQSLACYDCNSHLNSDCALDVVPDKYKVECPDSTYVLCRKIKQLIDFEVNGLQPHTRIIRTCGKKQDDPTKCYQRSGFGGRQIVCACESEGCNVSSTIYMSSTLLFAALVIVKISM